jgi:hypothetical protein
MNSPDDADVLEQDPPRRLWETYADRWRQRWQRLPRFTRTALAGGLLIVVVGGAGGGYAVARSAAPRTVSCSPATSQPEWLKGPHGKPWAEVAYGCPAAP